MVTTGTCQIAYAGRKRTGIISLDLDNARIHVRFAADPVAHLSLLKRERNKDYVIDNINIGLPNGAIRNGRIADLLLARTTNNSARDGSDLITALALADSRDSGQTVLSFIPRRSIVRLPINGLSGKELVFGVNRLRLQAPQLVLRISSRIVRISRDTATAIVVRGNAALLERREAIERAIGLAQGGRVNYRAGFSGAVVELNFVRDADVKALGPIYDDDDLVAEFIDRYVAYERTLSSADHRRFRLAMSYALDGCAGLPSLEQKVISMFTAIEILDQARTLSKGPVSRLLGINSEQGKVLIDVRNSIVHEGLGLYAAISQARHLSRAYGNLARLPFRVAGVPKSRAAANFHFYLVSRMLAAIATRIGMPQDPTSYLKTYSN